MVFTIIAATVISLGGWTLSISQRVSKTETYDQRLDAIETGRTTPMGPEARAEFNNLRREIGDMRERISLMHKSHNDLMRELITTVKEKKP